MRKRLSYANVTATLALFFAISGGAMAANHYLITSTKQISPKVLKKLTGKPGTNGTAGTTGATGATGPAGSPGAAGAKGEKGETGLKGEAGSKGETGEAGPLLTTLPSGKTLTGAFGGGRSVPSEDSDILLEGSISYQFPLASTPEVEVIQQGGASTEHCPGTPSAPAAAAGHLCIYVAVVEGTSPEPASLFSPTFPDSTGLRYGAVVFTHTTCAGACEVSFAGSWAVTAP